MFLQRENHLKVLPIILFLLLSVLFCLPLFNDLYSSCGEDWDYFMFLYEVPSIALFEYKQFPLWNPYCGGGISLIGNPQAGYLSPIFIVTSFFGVSAGLKIAVCLHTFLGLWGMWLLSGYLGISGPARLAPSFIFMFSSAWAVHLAMGHIVWLPAALLPLFFLAFLKGLENRWYLLAAAFVESMMFYEGGTYVFGFTLLFLVIYVAIDSVEKKTVQPILAFIVVNVFAALLSAPKLLPVLELLHAHPRPVDVGVGMPWYIWFYFFFDRFTGIERTFYAGWWAFGSYLGILVVCLYLFSFTTFRNNKALILTSLFLLFVSVGNFGVLSPWSILHKLPFFSAFDVPTRVLIVSNFAVALLVGFSLTHLGRGENKYSKPLISIVVFIILCDLFSVSAPTLRDATKPISIPYWNDLRAEQNIESPKLYQIPPDSSTGLLQSIPSVHQPFTQISIPFSKRNAHGAWSDQYLPLLQNVGVVDSYETIPFKRNALANSDNSYKGEYYLTGEGSISLREWSPNKLVFYVKNSSDTQLVINQNFEHGWRSSEGSVESQNGLLAIKLPPGDYEFDVYYLPKSFQIGIYLLIITLGILLIVFTKAFRSGKSKEKFHRTAEK